MGKILRYGEHPYKGRSDDLEPLKIEATEGPCWLCGSDTRGEGVHIRHAIKDTFTDHDLARAPWSKHICRACAWCLSWKYLRNYSIVASNTMVIHPGKGQLRKYLLSPPSPPFVMIIAVSGQKWLHFKSPVNHCEDGYIAMLEETPVIVNRRQLGVLIDRMINLLSVFSKSEIQGGGYSQSRVQKYGLKRWQHDEKEIATCRGSGLFDLALYASQKEEEKEGE